MPDRVLLRRAGELGGEGAGPWQREPSVISSASSPASMAASRTSNTGKPLSRGPSPTQPGHPPPPQADRLALAQAAPCSAGTAGAGLPAQGRDVRRAGGRVGIGTATAWCHRDPGPARRPLPQDCVRRWPRPRRQARLCRNRRGSLIPIGRVAADRPVYSGKHHRHGMNLQSSSAQTMRSCRCPGHWPGRARPDRGHGSGHCARVGRLRAERVGGQGHAGAGEHIHTLYKGRSKPAS